MNGRPIFKKSTCHRHGLTQYVCLLEPRLDVCAQCVRRGWFHESVLLAAKPILAKHPDPESLIFYAGLDEAETLAH